MTDATQPAAIHAWNAHAHHDPATHRVGFATGAG